MTRLLALILLWPALQADEPAVKVQKLNERLVAAFVELAGDYDSKKDPEACHFFAECAIGLGSKDEKTVALRKKWEDEVYYGRSRGGVVLTDTKPIEDRLATISRDTRNLFEDLVKASGEKGTDDKMKAALSSAAVMHEVARGASDYVRAVQRFNALRSKMKLRAILWEFTASAKLILGAWYMCETGDAEATTPDVTAISYTEGVKFARDESNRSPNCPVPLREYANRVRSFCLMREDLLNPDARRLWLGWWNGGAKLKSMALYSIPRGTYRKDIPTPSAKFRGETVVEEKDHWLDIEETIKVGSTMVPLARYPFDGETDTPVAFGDGAGDEAGWADPTIERKGLYSFGLPVMLRFFGGKELSEVDYELRKKGGALVSCKKYLNGDKRIDMEDLPTVLLLPENPFDKGTTYQVRIKGKLDGTPFERKWEFSTAK